MTTTGKKRKKQVQLCRHCQVFLPCYDHCQETEDGAHLPDPYSATQAEDTKFTVDYNCKLCGQSGGVQILPENIEWN
jgi:hypothetical protein